MIPFDWTALAWGLAIGTAVSALYFLGLRLGIQAALGSAKPVALLMLSSALRISALLGVGWLTIAQGGLWSFLGYVTAFFVIRFVVTTVARVRAPLGGGQ